MNSISLNMKFWHDGQPDSTRIRNVNFAWPKLKDLANFLREKNIECKENLYDFSPQRVLDESIHIPYPLGVYKKAEKTNIILKQNLNYKFFMMVDCDAFFDYEDFENVYNLLSESKEGFVYLFDLAKLESDVSKYLKNGVFDKNKAHWSYAYSGKKELGPLKQHTGGLGGVYISDTKLLNDLGGFDPSFEFWGGEDGDMLTRILTSGLNYNINSVRTFAPFHLPHFTDLGNPNYYKQ